MDRVPSLRDVDLPAVLGISLTAETRQRLDEIGHRIDLLRLPADGPGSLASARKQVPMDSHRRLRWAPLMAARHLAAPRAPATAITASSQQHELPLPR